MPSVVMVGCDGDGVEANDVVVEANDVVVEADDAVVEADDGGGGCCWW